MIVQERGHWKTIPAPDDRQSRASAAVGGLDELEQEALQFLLMDAVNGGSMVEDIAESEFEEVPVPIEEWVNDPYYFGETADTLYPKLKEDMVKIFSGDFHEIICTGSIGWGKDYFSTACLVRVLYELNCYKDPGRSLGLGAGDLVHIVIVSRTVEHAKRVPFTGLKQKLLLCDWFKGRFKITDEHIKFPGKNIFVVGAASSEASALGYNVYAGLMDEGNFMGKVKASHKAVTAGNAPDRAQLIYDGLVRRVKSRYQAAGLTGYMFMISSKRTTEDFTERRVKEAVAKGQDGGMYVMDYATWDVKPPYVDHPENYDWRRGYVSQAEGKVRVLEPDEEDPEEGIVFTFPDEYLPEFERDPAGAARDVAGIATDSLSPFISKRKKILEMMDHDLPQLFGVREWDMTSPLKINWSDVRTLNARNEYVPLYHPNNPRHVHIDLSKNQCATGFTVAHQTGITEVKRRDPETQQWVIEEAPSFQIDGSLRIVAPSAGEIDHETVREIVYRLIEGGMPIMSVSMDLWMSVPNEQQFKKKGLRTQVISTVRKIEPYLEGRNVIYEDRVKSPYHPQLLDELARIELEIKGLTKRIVAPPGVTKDLADSFAGAIYYLSQHARGGVVLAPSKGVKAEAAPGNGPRWVNGDPVWDDEQGYDVPGDDKKDGDLNLWIIS